MFITIKLYIHQERRLAEKCFGLGSSWAGALRIVWVWKDPNWYSKLSASWWTDKKKIQFMAEFIKSQFQNLHLFENGDKEVF